MANSSTHQTEHLEARVARLEASVTHIEVDIAEIKTDIRELRQELRTEISGLRQEFKADFRLLFNTLLTITVILGGLMLGLAGLMARGFGWL